MAINPELAAAVEISRLLRFPTAIKIEPFAKGRIELLKFIVPEASVLNHMRVMDVNNRLKSNVLICAVERGEDVVIPDGNFVIQSGTSSPLSVPGDPGPSFSKKQVSKTMR